MMLQYSTFEHRARFFVPRQEIVDRAMIEILLQSRDLKMKDHPRQALDIVNSELKRNESMYLGSEGVLGPLLCICANIDDACELQKFCELENLGNGLSEYSQYFYTEILEIHNQCKNTKAWDQLKKRICVRGSSVGGCSVSAALQMKQGITLDPALRTQHFPAFPVTDQSSARIGAPTAAVGSETTYVIPLLHVDSEYNPAFLR
jgi:hypothetical protein